ncbi:sigma-54 dependent transcriptional regulator [Myxococcota bacterium]|nr:sigma-54 dependent transcriptional regulator [Myxococcota bacterium]MBU1382708.1 sigma-54 dependent transcriptional regulator [Myxococcota bacterium]MBU1496004.1 sigma-54 dependent transcriptional regulator [Myxococcota bacterium]
MKKTVLVIDDEKNIRNALRLVLEGEGYTFLEADSAEKGIDILTSKSAIDVVLLDLKLGGMSGMEALKIIQKRVFRETRPVIIVISGQATTSEAMETVKNGAFDFLEKPLDRSRILVTVNNAFEHRRLLDQRDNLASQLSDKYEMIGTSPAILELFRQIEKIAPTKGRVLITGESGTGKELVARAIHKNSTLHDKPLIKVNCAAIPPELIESELFGHEKGAFTGALNRKIGLFELADGGTIFLDEIGDMSLNAQAKVLRVLQSGEVQRVGGEQLLYVDVRVIAATNRDLQLMVKDGTFREDLFFRLSVIPLHLPPLRERPEDIPQLVDGFVKSFCKEYGFKTKSIDQKAMEAMQSYNWPGNIRELKNQVERMVILSSDNIGVKDLPFNLNHIVTVDFDIAKFSHMSLKEFKSEMEKSFILMKLEECDWNITRAADILGLERTNLHKKLKSYNINKAQE